MLSEWKRLGGEGTVDLTFGSLARSVAAWKVTLDSKMATCSKVASWWYTLVDLTCRTKLTGICTSTGAMTIVDGRPDSRWR